MSESEGRPTAPRGRGALLYELYRKKQQQEQSEAKHADDASSTSSSVSTGGRGRGLLDKLRQSGHAMPSKPTTSQDEATPTRPGGRGVSIYAQLEKLRLAKAEKLAKEERESTKSPSTPASVTREKQSPIQSEPVIRRGKAGKTDKTVPSSANYIRFSVQPGKGVFEYDVSFNPAVDSVGLKAKMLDQYLKGGARTFDGLVLYLPELMSEHTIQYTASHPVDQSIVTVTIQFKRQRRLGECVQFFNLIFRRIFKFLSYTQINRQHYDSSKPARINQHKLEIWPGYVTAIDEYEGGVMLCIDCSHRVLRTDTVRTFLTNLLARGDVRRFHQEAERALVGCSVLTKYNNKLYKIDDILWDQTPKNSFQNASGGETTYVDYYIKQYGLKISDLQQPLLVNRAKRRMQNCTEKMDVMICLIPELCYMTGLTDDMRNDFTLMKDVAMYTRVTPNQRIAALKKFTSNIQSNSDSQKLLNSWGLKLDLATIDLEMRVLNPETIVFGGGHEAPGSHQADWTRAAISTEVISPIDLLKWVLIFTPQNKQQAENFKDTYLQIGRPLGIRILPPRMYCLQNDSTGSYVEAFHKVISPDVQLLVIICPTVREDRYNATKKITYAENPIPSQVINARTLSKPQRMRAIVQKIALQINCKLGGQLWSVRLPKHQWMVCGIDTYHDPRQGGRSVAGFVASMNQQITRWYSRVNYQSRGEELMSALKILFISALKKYFEVNGEWPTNVIIFRDGVSDGQLKSCRDFEIKQLTEAMQILSANNPERLPKLTFIVVQKRINTRLFLQRSKKEFENPEPGSIVDHTVTRRDQYDFFLVSQHVRQGTVSPTHYIVVSDNSNFTVEQVQKLTYKMCHLYYNWTGTIRLPAPCQYAHKLAYLVGQNIQKVPSESLADRLYYL